MSSGGLWKGAVRESMLAHAALALVIVWWLAAALIGIDFGYHWDEGVAIKVAVELYRPGQHLPTTFVYPTFLFDLTALVMLPDYLLQAMHAGPSAGWEAIRAAAQAGTYLIPARVLFVCVTSLTLICVYGIAHVVSRSRWQALLAAALLATSWEFGYHSRWVAADTLLAFWSALCAWCLANAMRRVSSRWLLAAAVAGGVATATKYPAGILCLPVAAGALMVARGYRRKALLLTLAGLVFALAYLLVTPGTVFDASRFIADVSREMTHYAKGHPGGHTIEPGWAHLRRILEYLALGSSPVRYVALLLLLAAAVGAVRLVATQWKLGIVLLIGPVAYVAYMSFQRVFIARNLMWLLPLLAVLAARGLAAISWALSRLPVPERALTVARVVFGFALVLPGAGYCSQAALGIASKTSHLEEFARYASGHEVSFTTTRRLAVRLKRDPRLRRAVSQRGTSGTPGGAGQLVAALASELRDSAGITAYRSNLLVSWFGPREVNLNYYPTWMGHDHVVLLLPETARSLNLKLARPSD